MSWDWWRRSRRSWLRGRWRRWGWVEICLFLRTGSQDMKHDEPLIFPGCLFDHRIAGVVAPIYTDLLSVLKPWCLLWSFQTSRLGHKGQEGRDFLVFLWVQCEGPIVRAWNCRLQSRFLRSYSKSLTKVVCTYEGAQQLSLMNGQEFCRVVRCFTTLNSIIRTRMGSVLDDLFKSFICIMLQYISSTSGSDALKASKPSVLAGSKASSNKSQGRTEKGEVR